jgi:hypothetical protein
LTRFTATAALGLGDVVERMNRGWFWTRARVVRVSSHPFNDSRKNKVQHQLIAFSKKFPFHNKLKARFFFKNQSGS